MLTVDRPVLDRAGPDTWRVSSRIHGAGLDHDIYFVVDVPVDATAETFVAAALPAAMALGTPLRIEAEVCPRLLANLETVQTVLSDWHPHLARVEVHATPRPPDPSASSAAAKTSLAFFSGGVDSFATVYRHRARLSRLLLVRGFDVAVGDDTLWASVEPPLRTAAEDLGTPLAIVETNVRQLLDRAGDWGAVTHGAAMASVAHLFPRSASQVLVAASHHLRDRFPWGTHPLLDPLWSTSAVEVVHDGAEMTRVDKTALIAEHEVALRHLRVCWRNPDQAYNCGTCEKCVRTMITLELLGHLGDCATLPHDLGHRLDGMILKGENTASFARDLVALATRRGRPDIVRVLERALGRYRRRRAVRAIRAASRSLLEPLRVTRAEPRD